MLVVGLDSADADLIERWCDAGHLPALAALRAQGTWRRIGTTAEVMHVSAWPSLYTGATPGRHGLYHAYQARAGEQEVHRTRAGECALPPFWELLDDAGRRCVVFDAFMSAPLEDFGGLQILEYGTWTWFDRPGARPPELWKELAARFGPYPAPEHTQVLGVPEPRRFRRRLLDGARVKGEATRWLMRARPWDLLFVTFGEAHAAGHYLWHLADADYPTHPAGGVAGLEHALRDVYQAIDAALGAIVAELDDDVTLVVTASDGMGPNYTGCHLVPEALHRLDLYHGAGVGRPAPGAAAAGARPRRSVAARARAMVPAGLRRAVSRCLPPAVQHRLTMKWANADVDWERTRAYALPNANEAYLRLNLAGREPRGLVAAGAAYDELVVELEARMGELVVPSSGARAARDVIRVDERFPGPRRGDLPDLVVTWSPEARVLDRLESPACGAIEGAACHATAPYYTGNHRPAAFALVRGPRARAGVHLDAGHVIDLAPTLLSMLGVEPAAHMQGEIWGELSEAAGPAR